MENIIIFVCLFIVVFLTYCLFVLSNKKGINKMKNGRELSFLKRNYNLDYETLNLKNIVLMVALSNSFILAFTTTLVCFLNDWIENIYLWLIACFMMSIVVLFPLILVLYNLIGSYYRKKQKKEVKKNV